jgi:hypothetical protein
MSCSPPAAANTITRKRAVFHGALGYAVELGLLPANPISLVHWRVPRAAVAVSPATVPSPAQVRGDPGPGLLHPAGAGRVLRLPVLRGAAPRRGGRAAPRAGLRPRLAHRPYDLRHAALSLWLNATGEPAEVAARARTSARVLHEVYLHCTDGQEDTVSQRIEDALDAATGTMHSPPHAKASGYTHRRHHPRTLSAVQMASEAISAEAGRCPDPAHA